MNKEKKNSSSIKIDGDKVFRKLLFSVTIFVVLILGGVFLTLVVSSFPSVKRHGLQFLFSKTWDQRMTVLEKVSYEADGEGKLWIQLRFSQNLDSKSIHRKNLVIRSAVHLVPFDWKVKQNELRIHPRETFVQGKNYDLVLKDSIHDEAGKRIAYSYRIRISLDSSLNPTFVVLDNKSSKPVERLDQENLRWFGALPFIVGTLLTSILALLISLPFSLAIAVFLGEYFTTGFFSSFMQTTSELLAGIPSIIYGFWAFFFIVPLMSKWFPQASSGGTNILTASLILAVMIIPYSSSLAREVILLVPTEIKEAAQGMGATRFEVIRQVILPYASSGIFAGIFLAFGRALGETMAVTMVIGNKNHIPSGLLDAGQTIASLIANEFAEAGDLKSSALSELGLILFTLTLLFGILGRFLIKKMSLRGQS